MSEWKRGKSQSARLEAKIAASDYKVIKAAEAMLLEAGKLSQADVDARQSLRDAINAAREKETASEGLR
jgi:hypothetical protein